MTPHRSLAFACVVLSFAPCALVPDRAFAQGNRGPLANVPRLLQVLDRDGFETLQGRFLVLDAVKNACGGVIPSAWYNNVQPYMVAMLPGRVGDSPAWETTERKLSPAYFLRQDEALLLVGSTPPPMAYFSFQTFLFMRYDLDSYSYDPTTGGFFRPYEAPFAYLGDTVNSLTIRTTGWSRYDRPMVLISTGNRTTRERLRGALRAAGYPDAIVNTETLPSSLLRLGYDKGDQFLFLMRTAISFGGDAAMAEYKQEVTDPTLSPLRVFRVRPRTEFREDPLPAPVLRTRGTGRTEMDLVPTMEKLRQAILAQHAAGFDAEELDTLLPDVFPEGYPAIQRHVVYLGPGREGSAGYGRDANYLVTSWFDLPDDGFAIIYGVDHAATGKATYSSVSVYLDQKLNIGVASADSADFAGFPHTANPYLPGDTAADKFYVWQVRRDCTGFSACLEAKSLEPTCEGKVAADAPVRVGFRAYAEPATRVGPADAELVYDRVIVFRTK
ncbi:MAG TPA: hypothetical protein VMT19_11930 [Thermoanaerobaculaceae bacterium]|nr:hypothetical protein [Thermoanaerobaculaceae bacterium]